ncbi:MAG: AMP-binding protein [Oscillospiraceae bacterium]|jgi:long-chain acyl-CoA synthetase
MKQFPLNPVDYYGTFSDFVDGLAEKYAEKPAVSYFTQKQEEVMHTYGTFTDQIYALRESLAADGLAGKHIAILSENSYAFLVTYLAITACGAVAVCIDAEQSDDTIRQMLSLADVNAAFVAGPYLPICLSVLPKEAIFSLPGRTEEGVRSFDQLCETGREALSARSAGRAYALDPDQPAVIVFTSGTSSLAKPVVLTHRNILQNASDSMLYVHMYDRVFTHLPFYHTYGMTCSVLNVLVQGLHLFINGNLKTVMRDMLLSKPDTLVTVPLMLEAIRNQIWLSAEQAGKAGQLKKLFRLAGVLRRLGLRPKFKALAAIREKAFGSIRIIISGGAALSIDTAREFDLLGIAVLQGYGITECSPLISVNSNHSHRIGSVGHVLPSLRIKIVDGEIWVTGPSLMPGYYQSPELTAEALEDGWFKTGDIGYIDSKDFLFITGRKKNLIVFKNGKKVSPEKMEEMVQQIPLVKEVVVYGATSGSSADDTKLAASIYPDPIRSANMNAYEILAHLQSGIDDINASLPFYQHIQMISIRQQPFAKTGSQKIKRHLV